MTPNQKHSIDITIDEQGKITSEVIGVTGSACTQISKFLDDLGAVTEDQHTPDYYRTPKQGITVKAG